MKLDERLKAVAGHMEGDSVIDIGSDHGYLPVYLILNGICSYAVATDIRKAPLERAKATARKYNVFDRMEFYLSDGFCGIDKTFDTACICGMGGNNIVDIIEKGKGKFRRLVLQPMSKGEILRKYLWDNGFVIKTESYPVEDSKPYTVMLVLTVETPVGYTYNDLFLGKIKPDDNNYRLYVKKVLSSAKKRYYGTKNPEDEGLIKECLNLTEKQN